MNVKKLRIKTGLNQTDFWSRVGVTQSGGSRYEAGRRLPKPVVSCLLIAYGTSHQRSHEFDRLQGAFSK